MLPEQIYNKTRYFKRFDSGTKPTIWPLNRLVRGNIQWPATIGLSTEPKILRINFLVNLQEQSTQFDEQRMVQMFKPVVELKNA